jgi:hypothetical protein
VTVVISASGSSCSPRSLQRASAESLPPLHESAKVVAGVARLSPRRRDGWGRDSTLCPLMKYLLVRRRRRPGGGGRSNRPSSEGRRSFGASGRPGSSPRRGHRSCGTAPDSHRTSRLYTGREICARRSRAYALEPMPRASVWTARRPSRQRLVRLVKMTVQNKRSRRPSRVHCGKRRSRNAGSAGMRSALVRASTSSRGTAACG